MKHFLLIFFSNKNSFFSAVLLDIRQQIVKNSMQIPMFGHYLYIMIHKFVDIKIKLIFMWGSKT